MEIKIFALFAEKNDLTCFDEKKVSGEGLPPTLTFCFAKGQRIRPKNKRSKK